MDIDECAGASSICDTFPRGGCRNTVGSFHCYCNDGYELDMNYKNKCYDVDECSINNGGCSQKCQNIDGSFQESLLVDCQ